MTHPSPKRNMVLKAILMRLGLVSLTTAKPVNTAQPRTTVNSARPMANIFNTAHSTVKRPINKNTLFKNSNQRVNTVRGNNVNTARPKAVVNVVKRNYVNAVKASTCWVWKPKTKVLDHVSKHNSASIGNTLQSGEDRLKLDELMEFCTKLQQRVLDLENTKTAQAQEITSLKLRVKKLEKKGGSRTHKLKRLYKVGRSARMVSSDDASLGDQEDVSKQGRKIDDIDKDAEITLIDKTQGRTWSSWIVMKMMHAHVNTACYNSLVLSVQLQLGCSPLHDVEISFGSQHTGRFLHNKTNKAKIQDKGKAKIIEPEPVKKLSKKDQLKLDEEVAQRLQATEQEELTIEERAILFQQLLEKRRKHFVAKRAKEKRNKPPIKAQQRSIMCTYLKNMEGWKPKDLKSKSFTNIQELFDKEMKRHFNGEQEMQLETRESIKKQKVDEDKETSELKILMEIIPDEEGK
ncbi:hypothetical protein Tco_0668282 [Tanacetum coccineum]